MNCLVKFGLSFVCVFVISNAEADITTTVATPRNIPQVQVSQGKATDCPPGPLPYQFNGPMAVGEKHKFPGAGTQDNDGGDYLCYRRSKDFDDARKGFGDWQSCDHDKANCDIK